LDKTKDENKQFSRFETFDIYLKRDDEKIKKKLEKLLEELDYTINKTKIDKIREEEKK
jgi:RNA-binding protein 25